MPAGVVKTKKDEKYWERAKDQAEKAGHKDNWAYVMAIYQKMKGASVNRFERIAYKLLMGE